MHFNICESSLNAALALGLSKEPNLLRKRPLPTLVFPLVHYLGGENCGSTCHIDP